MSSIYIVQLLCPARHAIIGVSYEENDPAKYEAGRAHWESTLTELADNAIKEERMDPWCRLCKAKRETWRTETAKTIFKTWAEAQTRLKELQAEQQVAAAAIVAEQKASQN
jgi:hypothetical protein